MLMKDTTHSRLIGVGIYSLHTTFYTKIINIQLNKAVFIRPSRTGHIMLSPVAGGRAASPNLCPEHIFKNMLATVMKLHGWIDLIKAECSAQEP